MQVELNVLPELFKLSTDLSLDSHLCWSLVVMLSPGLANGGGGRFPVLEMARPTTPQTWHSVESNACCFCCGNRRWYDNIDWRKPLNPPTNANLLHRTHLPRKRSRVLCHRKRIWCLLPDGLRCAHHCSTFYLAVLFFFFLMFFFSLGGSY